jgi:hypothetical protein
VQGFFDDINVSGEPEVVMKAFDALTRLLPEVGLEFNTAKSHFAYFHEAEAPLMRSTLTTLAEHNEQVHGDWVEVVGAVVGRDEAAIRAGVAATLGQDRDAAAFFARLQLDDLKVQSAMLILRQCGVPKMNYALRCTPPSCIAPQATAFDALVIGTAKAKLLLHEDEAKRRPIIEQLRAPLRHGDFGLTSALVTSPEAFLGSMAAVAAHLLLCSSAIRTLLCHAPRCYTGGLRAAWTRSLTRRPSAMSCCRRQPQRSSSTSLHARPNPFSPASAAGAGH